MIGTADQVMRLLEIPGELKTILHIRWTYAMADNGEEMNRVIQDGFIYEADEEGNAACVGHLYCDGDPHEEKLARIWDYIQHHDKVLVLKERSGC